MRIQHNIMAMNSYRNYTNNVSAMKTNLERLSSGYKINRAGDDAAGLAISEKMRAQVTALKQAQNNAKSGINLVQTAEGALQEVQDMLNRMVKLAEQSANGTYDDNVDRNQLQKEFEKLTEEIDRINQSANFNGMELFGGPGEAGGAGGGGGVTSALEATLDGTNAAKLGNVTVAFADDATEEQKAALNKALAGDFKFTTTDEGDNNWGAGDKIQIDKLPAGYTATFKDANNKDAALTAATDITVGTNDGELAAAGDLEITLKDGDGKAVATITVGKPTAGATGNSTVTFKEAAPAAAPAAADGADAAEGVTFEAKDGVNLGNFGVKSIDLSGLELDADATVKLEYTTGSDLKITVGDKVYTYSAGDTNSNLTDAADKEVEAADADGNKIKVTLAKGQTVVGNDKTTAVAEAEVGTAKAPADNTTTKTNGATSIGSYNLQIGDTADAWNKITVNRYSIGSASLKDISEGTNKVLADLSIKDEASAGDALTALKGMVNYISDIRGELGATQNRLTHTINNLSVMEENIQDAESTIRDTDVAEEMMAYTKNNILIQSAQAMLAQANQVPQGVLQLLQ